MDTRWTKIILFLTLFPSITVLSAETVSTRLPGRILLQVESRGEAWYINPADAKRYYLGQPDDAFKAIKKFGVGITNSDLAKIPAGMLTYEDADDDRDGLTNRYEQALGTDPNAADSDNDGYPDSAEITNGYDPNSSSTALVVDRKFAAKQAGKIFIQVQNRGEAWYVNPVDKERYYLGRPADAFLIMKKFGLGVTNQILANILIGVLPPSALVTPPISQPAPIQPNNNSPFSVFSAAAAAFRNSDTAGVKNYFSENTQGLAAYTMNFLSQEGRFILGNLMAGAEQTSLTDSVAVYTAKIYFQGEPVNVIFKLFKQSDGNWKLVNL